MKLRRFLAQTFELSTPPSNWAPPPPFADSPHGRTAAGIRVGILRGSDRLSVRRPRVPGCPALAAGLHLPARLLIVDLRLSSARRSEAKKGTSRAQPGLRRGSQGCRGPSARPKPAASKRQVVPPPQSAPRAAHQQGLPGSRSGLRASGVECPIAPRSKTEEKRGFGSRSRCLQRAPPKDSLSHSRGVAAPFIGLRKRRRAAAAVSAARESPAPATPPGGATTPRAREKKKTLT